MTALSRAERLDEELQRARAAGTESETARRGLATENNELTMKLGKATACGSAATGDADALRHDMDTRLDSNRHEISQLRTMPKSPSEIRQLRDARHHERPAGSRARRTRRRDHPRDERRQSGRGADAGRHLFTADRHFRSVAAAGKDGWWFGQWQRSMRIPPAE